MGGRRRVRQRDVTGLAQDLTQRPVGDILAGREAVPPKHRRLRTQLHHRGDRLPHQPGLAHAGLTKDDQQPGLSVLDDLLEEVEHGAQLGLAPDDGAM